jgi:magnesium-transporting ATPase (P-type)
MYAYKDIDIDEWDYLKETSNNFESDSDREILERNLVFLAFYALNDELRDGVDEIVA